MATKSYQPKEPLIKGAELRSFSFGLEHGFANSLIKEHPHNEISITEGILDSVIFEDIDFASISFKDSDLTNVIFRRCTFLNYEFPKRYYGRLKFDSCNMLGARFIGVTLEDVTFYNCNLSLANFSEATFKKVLFSECKMSESYFAETTMPHAFFERCSLAQSEFFKASLKDIDLRTDTIDGLHCDVSSLPGLIVTPYQALLFVPLLGLVVKEEGETDDKT
jgi:uncharacterized protein YjbI with pentapeptide repeats